MWGQVSTEHWGSSEGNVCVNILDGHHLHLAIETHELSFIPRDIIKPRAARLDNFDAVVRLIGQNLLPTREAVDFVRQKGDVRAPIKRVSANRERRSSDRDRLVSCIRSGELPSAKYPAARVVARQGQKD